MVAPPSVDVLVAVRGGQSSVRSAVAIGQGLWSSSEGRITIGTFCPGRPVGIRAALALKNHDHIEEDKMLQQDLSADVRAERTEFADVPDVVVADDGGCGSRRALEQAAREAERRRARLVVVTVVISSQVEPEGWAAWNRAERDAGDHARAVNAAAQRRVRDRRPRLAVQGVVTASGSDIAAFAMRAGLLVLGRRGASGKGVFRMGTTSGDLVRQFRCPVLVCRDEQSGRPRSSAARSRNPEVVAAVHVPAETTTVLRRAVREAEFRAMPLCVFSSGRTPSTPFLETALAAEKSVPWRLVWTAGVAAAEALLRYADPDDLLVLGNRGGGRLAGHMTASVTRAVLDDMPCDVMLVPL